MKRRTYSGMKTSLAPRKKYRAAPPSAVIRVGEGEFKSIYTAPASYASNTGTVVQLINGLTQGAGIGQRIGQEILMRSVQLNAVSVATAGTGTDQRARILLVYDRQANGGAPAMTDVLESASEVAMRNLQNRKRFKILMDKCIHLNATGESDSEITWRFYRKLRHPVTFNAGNAGTVADIATGSMYLMFYGSNGAGATAGSCLLSARIRFTDK